MSAWGWLLLALLAVPAAWTAFALGGMHAELRRLGEQADRVGVRLGELERRVESYWEAVDRTMGRIHQGFESGRACRVGATLADVDRQMGTISRKLSELLESPPAAGREP